jgi:AcrR family transcriptional regulator
VSETVKRDLRAARRAETEARLIEAASDLFVESGYAGTTLAEVANRAGVAERTVYVRFATKAALLHRCLDVAIAGDAEPIAIADRDWMDEAMTAPTRAIRIRLMARITAGLMARAGPLLRVAQQAEATEPAIAAAAQAGRTDTQRTLGAFWERMADDGLLPANCDVPWLAKTATVLAHADTYLLLTKLSTWEPAEYESWLATTWDRLAASSAT